VEQWEPVGSFCFNKTAKQIEFELDYKRPAKYVFLKPTDMRDGQYPYSKYFDNSPLEIKFFGVKGQTMDGPYQARNVNCNL